jgi:hypothetical protein
MKHEITSNKETIEFKGDAQDTIQIFAQSYIESDKQVVEIELKRNEELVGGMSKGAIMGIFFNVLLLYCCLGVYFYIKKKKERN